MSEFTNSDWISIIGWPATFVLGIVATIIAQRIGKTRKRISWSLVSESNLLSQEALEGITDGFRVPIQFVIDGRPQANLSTIRIKLANTGNVEVENITLQFGFGNNANVLVGRYLGDLGAYRDLLKLDKNGDTASLSVQHINPKQTIEVEFLVSEYDAGDLDVDMAAPGVLLIPTSLVFLEASMPLIKSIAFAVMGVRNDPEATNTGELVKEIKRFRKVIEQNASSD